VIKKVITRVNDMLKRLFAGETKEDRAEAALKAQYGMTDHQPFNPARFTGKSGTFKKNQRAERVKSAKREARRKGQV